MRSKEFEQGVGLREPGLHERVGLAQQRREDREPGVGPKVAAGRVRAPGRAQVGHGLGVGPPVPGVGLLRPLDVVRDHLARVQELEAGVEGLLRGPPDLGVLVPKDVKNVLKEDLDVAKEQGRRVQRELLQDQDRDQPLQVVLPPLRQVARVLHVLLQQPGRDRPGTPYHPPQRHRGSLGHVEVVRGCVKDVVCVRVEEQDELSVLPGVLPADLYQFPYRRDAPEPRRPRGRVRHFPQAVADRVHERQRGGRRLDALSKGLCRNLRGGRRELQEELCEERGKKRGGHGGRVGVTRTQHNAPHAHVAVLKSVWFCVVLCFCVCFCCFPSSGFLLLSFLQIVDKKECNWSVDNYLFVILYNNKLCI